MNPSRPAAFRPLILVRQVIEDTLGITGIKKYSYTPKHIKSRIHATDDSKEAMTEALIKNKEITSFVKEDDLRTMSEHEIDAIAVAYVELLNTREKGLSRWDILLKS